MVYQENTERNEELVMKRIKDPKKWGWGALGKHYGIHRSYVKEIFERDFEKYAHEDEIEKYYTKLK